MSRSFADTFIKTEASADTLVLPDELSAQYNVRECLAKNDFGETYVLTEKESNKPFVLKCYIKSQTYQIHEAELMRGLKRKGLSNLVAEFENGDTLYVLREYAAGVPLNEFVAERGVIDEAVSIRIAMELCDIMTYLHTQPEPIIHRDIKPSNIIINPEDNGVTLIDFGIARKYSKTSDTDTMYFGTEKFAPPEQYGFAQTDGRSDIYALGMVMRYMLTGKPDGDLQSGGMAQIIAKCTEFSPKDRYKSADILKRTLRNYRIRTIRRAILTAASVVLVCLLVVGGVCMVRYANFSNPPAEQSQASVVASEPPKEDESVASDAPVEDVSVEMEAYTFADPFVEKAVRAVLGKPEDDIIYRDDLNAVTGLYFAGEDTAASMSEFYDIGMFSFGTNGALKDLNDLANMENLQELYISLQPIADLSPLASCALLDDVHLSLCSGLRDISPLASCTQLQSLYLYGCGVSDLSPLTGLPTLSDLRLIMMDGSDLSSLQDIASLRLLHIGFMSSLRSVTELGVLGQINELVLHDTSLENLNGIENFTSLTKMNLASAETITDFSALDNAPSLREVYINPEMEADFNATVTREDIGVTLSDSWSSVL